MIQQEIKGTVTCPSCGHKQVFRIPTESCQAFYQCEGCKKLTKAQKSCCVFCDFGDRPCPAAKAHKKRK